MAQSAILTIMTSAARKAGRSLVRDFGEVENLQVSRKGPADFVSNADRRSEEIVFEELQKARPTYDFLLEEGGEVKGSDGQHRWIVDPLDGTTNFLHSIPLFAVAIALERRGEIVAGVIYNPVSDELFTAERGQGVYCNNRRLRVAGRRTLADSVGVTGIKRTVAQRDRREVAMAAHMNAVLAGLRRTGSACLDLAWTAAGRFDLFWELGLQPWDMAPGILMVREAGGTVSDIAGNNEMFAAGSILAGNENVHRLALAELKSVS